MHLIKILALSLWMLPQNLLGMICFMGFLAVDWLSGQDSKVIRTPDRVILNSSHQYSGVTLGFFIILPYQKFVRYFNAYTQSLRHETGHYHQSKILGPLYLLVIGIPSILWNIFQYLYTLVMGKRLDYYKFYSEKWADKLGNIKR